MKKINDELEGTPFQISYRVMNELVIYLAVLLDQETEKVEVERFKTLMNQALDDITLMKILPRVEGDEELLGLDDKSKLEKLKEQFNPKSKSRKKLIEMIERLERSGFTRFCP